MSVVFWLAFVYVLGAVLLSTALQFKQPPPGVYGDIVIREVIYFSVALCWPVVIPAVVFCVVYMHRKVARLSDTVKREMYDEMNKKEKIDESR